MEEPPAMEEPSPAMGEVPPPAMGEVPPPAMGEVPTIDNGSSIQNESQVGGYFDYVDGEEVSKFIEFLDKTNTKKIDPNKLKIVKARFKLAPRAQYQKICRDNSRIVIKATDEKNKAYLDNYISLKNKYLNHCASVFELLETKILDQSKKDYKFKLKIISHDELRTLEDNVRDMLKNIYIKCHQLYLKGIEILSETKIDEGSYISLEKKTNNNQPTNNKQTNNQPTNNQSTNNQST